MLSLFSIHFILEILYCHVLSVFLPTIPDHDQIHKFKPRLFSFLCFLIGLELSRSKGLEIMQKRNWKRYLSLYWCFGCHKNKKQISHAFLVPEHTDAGGAPVPTAEISSHPNPIVMPFIAPPSSSASVLRSKPPSSAQSPGGLLSLMSLSANVYSPQTASSAFATGPYAHETQFISPAAFSAFTAQPSTAPYTPPEPVQMTTPSSPDVPYAKLLTSLEPNRRGNANNQKYILCQTEFQPYHLYLEPGLS
uniref:Uncharacterized protein n=1 Tax=Kalanchoe fedtschenkoi TaxID=63787 RepID=A0A7N0URQ2_KALFE